MVNMILSHFAEKWTLFHTAVERYCSALTSAFQHSLFVVTLEEALQEHAAAGLLPWNPPLCLIRFLSEMINLMRGSFMATWGQGRHTVHLYLQPLRA